MLQGLSILKASLTSTSALTNGLKHFITTINDIWFVCLFQNFLKNVGSEFETKFFKFPSGYFTGVVRPNISSI